MFAKLVVLLLFVAVSVRAATDAETEKSPGSNEHSSVAARDYLISQLFDENYENYNKDNYPENSTVKLNLVLLNADLDEEHGILDTNTWLRVVYQDNRLRWDEKYFGVDVLRLPSQNVWTPDTTIYNGVNQAMDCTPTNVMIYPNGEVLWIPPCRIQSYCNITLTGNPYGVNECEMKFGSWAFDGLTMGFDFYSDDYKTADLSDYSGSQRWKIVKSTSERVEKTYDCCIEPYIFISYHLSFQKPGPEGYENCRKR